MIFGQEGPVHRSVNRSTGSLRAHPGRPAQPGRSGAAGAHSPLRSRLCVESCRALSGQFQRSQPNWNLHSSMPLCAPAATLLENVR